MQTFPTVCHTISKPGNGWTINSSVCSQAALWRQVFVGFTAIPTRVIEELRNVLRQACTVFQQKCVYLSVAGHVEFIGSAHENE
jgi:hypothetical protein